MHETAVAHSLLQTILAESQKQNAKPIRAKISCGVLNAINDELLTEAFGIIAKETPCHGLGLQIEHKPMQGHCNTCGKNFEFEITSPYCSYCSSKDFELLPDEPLILETIEFQSE